MCPSESEKLFSSELRLQNTLAKKEERERGGGYGFVTSRRRPLSLTVLPSGMLSFVGSGLEGVGLVICFLEGLSWLARGQKSRRTIHQLICDLKISE